MKKEALQEINLLFSDKGIVGYIEKNTVYLDRQLIERIDQGAMYEEYEEKYVLAVLKDGCVVWLDGIIGRDYRSQCINNPDEYVPGYSLREAYQEGLIPENATAVFVGCSWKIYNQNMDDCGSYIYIYPISKIKQGDEQ